MLSGVVLVFVGLFAGILSFELGLFSKNKKGLFHAVSMREALVRTICYVGISLLFSLLIYFKGGEREWYQYVAGYLLEMSLSLDNVFVFIIIFMSFGVQRQYQNYLLFFGIIGAIVLRAPFIFGGVALVNKFDWVLLVFAVILLISGVKIFMSLMKKGQEDHNDIKKNKFMKFLHHVLPVTPSFHDDKFFVRVNHKRYVTPLFIIMLFLIFADVVFAFDSIPAIFSVTRDSFIIYSSNMFAILGLRSMFFVLENAMEKFKYLKVALAVVLMFIGVKMVVNYFYHEFISVPVALIVLFVIMGCGVLVSIVRHNR